MINLEATHRNVMEWVKSPAFDPYFNAMVPKVRLGYFFSVIFILSGAGIPIGIGLLIASIIKSRKRSKGRKEAHLAYANREPILAGIVIANRMLLTKKGAVAPALLIGKPRYATPEYTQEVADQASALGELYGNDPMMFDDPTLQNACAVVNDDNYKEHRRRPSPPINGVSNVHQLTLYDTMLSADLWGGQPLDYPFVVCLTAPGDEGAIIQIPADRVVWLKDC